MNIAQAYASAWKHGITFKGRATPSEFWWVFPVEFILFFVCNFMSMILGGLLERASELGEPTVVAVEGLIVLALTLFCIWMLLLWLSLMSRRLHDANLSAGWLFLYLFPLLIIVLMIMCLKPGTKGDNRFGPAPLAYMGMNPQESHWQAAQRNQEFESKLRGSFNEHSR